MMLHILPFGIWVMDEFGSIEVRKKLFPGREDLKEQEQSLERKCVHWCFGLVLLLVAYVMDAHLLFAQAMFVAIQIWILGWANIERLLGGFSNIAKRK